MLTIDAHLHFSRIKRFQNCANIISHVNYTTNGLLKEFKDNNIILGVGMGIQETSRKSFPDAKQSNPMKIDLEANLPVELKYCLGINPLQLDKDLKSQLTIIEKNLQSQKVVGLKLYPGYFSVPVTDPIYDSLYRLADEYNLPLIIHCGKTYSVKGYLQHSHPLLVNEVALNYPRINFVIAHFGDPWVMDTAAIISNNSNVYTDLSGLVVGDEKAINERTSSQLFNEHFLRALDYAQSYDKILFGSDWPLVPLKPYINWIKMLIPKVYHQKVFYDNSLNVFELHTELCL